MIRFLEHKHLVWYKTPNIPSVLMEYKKDEYKRHDEGLSFLDKWIDINSRSDVFICLSDGVNNNNYDVYDLTILFTTIEDFNLFKLEFPEFCGP